MAGQVLYVAVFCGLSVLILGGAVLVVSQQRLLRSVAALGIVYLGIAGLFILLRAEFLALAHVLMGACALAANVFTSIHTDSSDLFRSTCTQGRKITAGAVSFAVFLLLVRVAIAIPTATEISENISAGALGQQLMGPLILPFEVLALVLVAVMAGTVIAMQHNRGTSRL